MINTVDPPISDVKKGQPTATWEIVAGLARLVRVLSCFAFSVARLARKVLAFQVVDLRATESSDDGYTRAHIRIPVAYLMKNNAENT
jgi:hypothetical protein